MHLTGVQIFANRAKSVKGLGIKDRVGELVREMESDLDNGNEDGQFSLSSWCSKHSSCRGPTG
jgi:hypothetical protein